jgi:hypothetical protein
LDSPRGCFARIFVVLAPLLALGCGDGSSQTVPVNGTITFGGTPVTAASTIVLFKPDKSKGNESTFEPVGTVDAEGNYELTTEGRKGAPPGWYRVVVTAHDQNIQLTTKKRVQRPTPKGLLPARYGSFKTTNLLVQVVEEPATGAYDLKLTK